jgi:hypothetical protein
MKKFAGETENRRGCEGLPEREKHAAAGIVLE